MPRFAVWLIGLAFLVSACGSVKVAPNYSTIRPEIQSLTILRPVIYLEKILNQGRYLDPESGVESGRMISTALQDALGRFYQTEMADGPDLQDQALSQELWQFCMQAKHSTKLESLVIPVGLKDYLNQRGYRFFVLAFQNGFSRDSANMASENLKSAGIALLTLGSTRVAIPAVSDIYILVLDKEAGYPIYFGYNHSQSSPVKKQVLRRQVSVILYQLLGKDVLKD